MPGPNPTFAQSMTQLGLVIAWTNAVEQFGNTTSPNALDKYDAVIGGLDGEYVRQAIPVLDAMRAGINVSLTPANLRSLYRPFLWEAARAAGLPEFSGQRPPSDETLLRVIRRYMVDNAQSFNSRGMTFGSVAGSGTGTGVIRRVTVDKDNEPLESTTAEIKRFECWNDQASGGQKHQEVFRVTAGDEEPDNLQYTGSGLVRTLTVSNATTAANYLKNPSFDVGPGSAADGSEPTSTTVVTNWTLSAAASFDLRTAAAMQMRSYPGAPSTQFSLEFVSNGNVEQILRTANPGIRFDRTVAYLARVAWKRRTSATGTLTLEFGASTASVDVSTGTNDVWNVLTIAMGTGCYYDVFGAETDMNFKVTMGSLAVGTVVIDDCIVAPGTLIGGQWFWADGGNTAWLRGDTYTFTDTDGSRAKYSYWLGRAWGQDVIQPMYGWFPTDNSAAETITDPSA